MYVAHTGADRMDVLDCESRSYLRALPDLPGVAGVLVDEEQDLLVSSDRAAGRVSVFRCSDERLLGRVEVGRATIERTLDVPTEGPHGLWLDSGRLFCAADGGALIVLDRDTGEVVASLPLPGVPDVVMLDPEVRRVYVAVGGPGVVCSFDSERLEQVETIETEEDAHTIGWDPVDRCLYVFCPQSSGAIVYAER